MNKIWMGICAVIAATGVGVGVAQHVQPGGAVHKVDRQRPRAVIFSKGAKPVRSAMAEGTRVPVLPPAPVATLPAAPYAPPAVPVASVVTDSKAEDPCVCPLGASLPAAAMPASIQTGDARRDPAVAELVSRICASVKVLPQTANAEDLEASIVFAIAQSKASDAVVRQALAMMAGCDNGWSNMPAALRRVQDGLGKLNRGTASLGSGFLGSGSSFSAPTLAVGGGSANYGI